jgi:hypothetical protein
VAITEDTANQPAAVHAGGTSGTTGSFTPPASRLLVALVAVDGNSGTATTVTMSDTASGVWSLLRRTNSSVAGLGGSAEVWIRDCITSPGAITVTASWAGGGGAVGGNVVVRTLIGAAPVASQTGATGGASGTPGTVAASVTPNTLGSRIYGAALDYTSAITMTVNANTTSIDQFVDTTNGDTWAVFKASADTASLSATSFGYSTSASFNLAAAEVLPTAGGGGTGVWIPVVAPARRRVPARPARSRTVKAPPAQAVSTPTDPGRRTRPPLPKTRARIETPVRAQVNPPYPTNEDVQPRRLRGLLARRGRATAPPWPQQTPAVNPDWIAAPRRPRQAPEILRRNHVWSPPWPQQSTPVAPLWIPAGHRSRPLPELLRRDRATAPPAPAATTPPAVRRPRQNLIPARRERLATPVPPAGLWVPPGHRPRPAAPVVRPRRQERLVIAAVVALANPPIVLLQPHHRTLMPPVRRRARVFAVPLVGAAPVVPTAGLVLILSPPVARWFVDEPEARWLAGEPGDRWFLDDPYGPWTAGLPEV